MSHSIISSDDFLNYDLKVEKFRKIHFKHLKEVYLDHAGSTIHSYLQISNFTKDLSDHIYGNPHSNHVASKRSLEVIEEMRPKILEYFNTSLSEYSVVFVHNTSAALNLIATCFKFRPTDFQCINSNKEIRLEGKAMLNPPSYHSCGRDCNGDGQGDDDDRHGNDGGQGDDGRGGAFVYLDDCHTSVVGMRNPVLRNGGKVVCVSRKKVDEELSDRCFKVDGKESEVDLKEVPNNLFVYLAQSNFSGERYPLSWIESVRSRNTFMGMEGHWYVLLDAASMLTTSTIDLSQVRPDFLAFSFHKIFGFPTGLGCLLVKKSSQKVLEKNYFGGGTIDLLLPNYDLAIFRSNFSERFEDGTPPFFEILAVKHGFQSLEQLTTSPRNVSSHTFALAKYTYDELKKLTFSNGQRVVELYHSNEFESQDVQGAIVNFNVLKTDGSHMGYFQVNEMAKLHGICMRTGCFCNIGACQNFMGMTPQKLIDNYNSGHVCGDGVDLIDGRPTGSIRVSFGFSSTLSDVDTFLEFVRDCFLREGDLNLKECFDGRMRSNSKVFNLKEIWVYPIKSCFGIQMDSCLIDGRGLKYDRKWMIANQSNRAIVQKDAPDLCKIKCSLDGDVLKVKFDGLNDITVDNRNDNSELILPNACTAKVCSDKTNGGRCDAEINEWFSSALKMKNIYLIRQTDLDERTSAKGDGALLSFANKAQFLLIGSSSLEIVHKKLTSCNKSSIDLKELAKRFRANLLVNTNKPFEEENWNEIKIGKERFKKVGLCTRCKTICYDQTTGSVSKEPLLTLMNFPLRKANFGVLLVHMKDKINSQPCISVGAQVEILKYD